MTTIATNRHEMACDTQATHGGTLKFKVKTKITAIHNKVFYPKPFLIGYCGSLEIAQKIISYLRDATEPAKMKNKDCEFLILTEDKKIYTFVDPNNWMEVADDHYAIGSGMHYAMGAFKHGATPKEAVQAASKLDPSTGTGIKVISIE